MPSWFDENEEQVVPRKFRAFGIECESRYGRHMDFINMLMFARSLAELKLEPCVEKVLYDSKSETATCDLTLEGMNSPQLSVVIEHAKWCFDSVYIDGELHVLEDAQPRGKGDCDVVLSMIRAMIDRDVTEQGLNWANK